MDSRVCRTRCATNRRVACQRNRQRSVADDAGGGCGFCRSTSQSDGDLTTSPKNQQCVAGNRAIQPHVPVQHRPTTSIYYLDPDGNMVELQIDNFTTPEDATQVPPR